jgi:homoprotocatechuate degradation regulator HpaR
MAQFRPVLNANGLTEQQWRVLRALLINGPLEPRQLCACCRISSPSITGVLVRMEEAGLVERKRMANDQRRLEVSATPRAKQLGRRMFPAIDAQYAHIEELVGADALGHVYDVLDALLGALGTAPAPDVDMTSAAPGRRVNGAAARRVPPTRARAARPVQP